MLFLLGMVAALTFGCGLAAQTTESSSAIPPSALSPVEEDRPQSNDVGSDSSSSSAVTLSADQIISILEERPQLLVEVKSLIAESQQQTVPIQPDSITDEMLYSQIASSKELRANITVFLRARGYVSDEMIHRDTAEGQGDDVQAASLLPQSGMGASGAPERSIPATKQGAETTANGRMTSGERGSGSGRTAARDGDALNANPLDRKKAQRNITEEPEVLRQPAPYNLISLRDLYTQIPDSPDRLKRFGSEVFLDRGSGRAASFATASNETPLDVPLGPDYVVGPGDSLTIDIWGGVSQTIVRLIQNDGHITLPEAGDIQVAGLTLESAQSAIQNALRPQYRNAQIAVAISRLRTIRIYVLGDVQRPGAYEISSLRVLRHFRGKQLIDEVDLYDFLLNGVRDDDDRMQGGDTLIVPASGPQVAAWGAIKRPAIYELKGEATLAALLENAGGVTVAAALSHIAIERVDANQRRETISLDVASSSDPDAARKAIAAFQVKDGDRIHVAPIAPFSERVIYVEGHVVRPGRHPYRDGMHLSDVLQSYQDVLPEPASRGEIVRLVPPDLHVETLDFNVPDALIGNVSLGLQPFDTIRILGRYEADAPKVEVRGEVLHPGIYPMPAGMTAAQLVRMSGGFKRDALLETADLISYDILDGRKIESHRSDVRIGDAVQRDDPKADTELKPGDVLTVHQITGWSDIGATMMIEGEVSHPGSYGFQEGEHLSDVLRRAGGFREIAYPAGAVLVRDEVRTLEEKSRVELIRQIETSSAAARLSSNIGNSDQSGQMQLIQQQQDQILSRLRSQPATGRLVIHISADIDRWAGTSADIEVRRGDVLRIPKRPGFVLVSGQVYNVSAITFAPGKTAGWYLQRAGGSTAAANRKEIFVIRANGSVVGRRSGEWYDRDVLSTHLQPGDVIVVPQKIIGASMLWRNLLSTAQIASSIAITTALAGL
jgi:protein involved in polysaccharide export with SLBB domain